MVRRKSYVLCLHLDIFHPFCYQDDSDANYNDDAGRVIRLDKTCEKVGFCVLFIMTITNILALLA